MFQKMSPSGKAVSILTINDDNSFALDEAALKNILTSADIKDKPLCIIPVAGGCVQIIIISCLAERILQKHAYCFY